ncbi:MAG: hypothetical protein E6G95_07225 [Alphaproteobacteria bacterium]|nr:MAG: hypothetical protein E6G95_07225 [Alphaproteobacteria bacterium]
MLQPELQRDGPVERLWVDDPRREKGDAILISHSEGYGFRQFPGHASILAPPVRISSSEWRKTAQRSSVRFKGTTVADDDLDLKSLDIMLQRVRRNPQDRAFRAKAAEGVAKLADFASPASLKGQDGLLAEAIRIAKLLRRALDRANHASQANSNDIAAMTAWIDALHPVLLKTIERPSQD